MARSIAADNVVGLDTGKKKGGRKGGASNGLPTAHDRRAAAEAAFATVQAAGNKARPDGATGVDAPTAAPAPAQTNTESAPGLGHNRADESVFLRHVHAINRANDAVEAAKAVLKAKRGELKDIRQLAKADGLVLKDLDEALADAATERVDLIEKEERRRKYREWIGLPVGIQGAFEFDDRVPEAGKESAKWWALGNTDGRMGRDPKAPDWCPPDRVQDYLKGHEAGQLALMKDSPLTAAAFDKSGELKVAPADGVEKEPAEGDQVAGDGSGQALPAAEPEAPAAVLVLREDAFAEGTALDDANLSTLVEDRVEAWSSAERVVAVFGGKRRILKEPGYEDTGAAEVEVSEVEDAGDGAEAFA